MTTMTIKHISNYTSNWGHACEQDLIYALCGEIRPHDSGAFDKGSDYEEEHLSIKSQGFSLASAKLMTATTFDGQIEEYFIRTASTKFAYVTLDSRAFFMNAEEFKEFLYRFCRFTPESSSHGGQYKVRMRKESKAVISWLEERAN